MSGAPPRPPGMPDLPSFDKPPLTGGGGAGHHQQYQQHQQQQHHHHLQQHYHHHHHNFAPLHQRGGMMMPMQHQQHHQQQQLHHQQHHQQQQQHHQHHQQQQQQRGEMPPIMLRHHHHHHQQQYRGGGGTSPTHQHQFQQHRHHHHHHHHGMMQQRERGEGGGGGGGGFLSPPGHHHQQQHHHQPPRGGIGMFNGDQQDQQERSSPQHQHHQQQQQHHQHHQQHQHQHQHHQQQHQHHHFQRHHHGPPPKREATNTVWLGAVDSSLSDYDLRRMFAPFGKVMRVSRIREKDTTFIHFVNVAEAQRAVEEMDGNAELGPHAKLNFGKLFTYTPEDEDMAKSYVYDPSRGGRGGGGRGGGGDDPYSGYGGGRGGGGRGGFDGRFDRRREDEIAPSNILYVGDITPEINDDDLRRNFEIFGTIKYISRIEHKNVAFVHFESEQECTAALGLRGTLIRGVAVKLNYGKPPPGGENNSYFARGGGGGGGGGGTGFDPTARETLHAAMSRETPTNVVWIGGLPESVTPDEIDALYDEYPGYIDAKLMADKGFSFGHFDTVLNAVEARKALHNKDVKGSITKVSFGKQNHSRTMADKPSVRAKLQENQDFYNVLEGGGGGENASPQGSGSGGPRMSYEQALALLPGSSGSPDGGALSLLPADAASRNNQPVDVLPKFLTRNREAPSISVNNRTTALVSSTTYLSCCEVGRAIIPTRVGEIITLVDECESEEQVQEFVEFLRPSVGFNFTHVIGIIARRLKEHYANHNNKKLKLFYVVAQLLLMCDPSPNAAAMDMFVVLSSVVVQNQSDEGMGRVEKILGAIQKAYLMPSSENNSDGSGSLLSDDMRVVHKAELDFIVAKKKASADLSSLMKRVKKSD